MKRLTIQMRIALWYLATSLSIVALFATCSWFAMRASMLHSTDRDLKYRLRQVVPFVQAHYVHTEQQFKGAFGKGADAPVVGVFVQFTTDDSAVIFESDVLRLHDLTSFGVGPSDNTVAIRTLSEPRNWPIRIASQRVLVSGVPLTVHLVEPLKDTFEELREYTLDLCGLIAAALVLITSAGYFLSVRALEPVERIRKEAEAIDLKHLASRLPVPVTEDELKRLALTLNAMLARIENGFLAVQQFTADASHELRTPLALIITAAEVTLRRERSCSELEDTLRKVILESRRMSALIDQLLALARGDLETPLIAMSKVEISSLAREVCEEFRPLADVKKLSISCIFPPGDCIVPGSEKDVRRVLFALLDNAVRYTERGSIDVNVTRASGRIDLVIKDSGIGIDPKDIPRIFDRFWRADKVRSRDNGGAGLGLSLVYQIVARLNARISVTSQPEEGSCFTVHFNT